MKRTLCVSDDEDSDTDIQSTQANPALDEEADDCLTQKVREASFSLHIFGVQDYISRLIGTLF
jgi:hypothetical protein